MARTVAIGIQDFEKMITENCFYIDKTSFIKEWWDSRDSVTLITRPRRFGKTLNLSMLNRFFSNQYAGQSEVFEGLFIWKDEEYRKLQGTYPVINLSFANIKDTNYKTVRKKICQLLTNLYVQNAFLLESDVLLDADKNYFKQVSSDMDDSDATLALYQLSDYLYRYYGKKVIILLDEYDTPMQEAYVYGYWEELTAFTRSLFNATFKTNPWLERGLMTGITRVSKESIFSDLNHLEVVTTTSDKYAASFGFTEEEVFGALEEVGLSDLKQQVKKWYNGFVFGKQTDIYNPWSILNFLDKGNFGTYWVNTSANSLIGKLIREGNSEIKKQFETLLQGNHLWMLIDEQVVYTQLDENEEAIWSLLLASGYLKVLSYESYLDIEEGKYPRYELALTNLEVKKMFEVMVKNWFAQSRSEYNSFIKVLLINDIDAMNEYMNRVALKTFSYFDTGGKSLGTEPERFYHGFVLGLMVDLSDRYMIMSNRESGFGRYDVLLEPRKPEELDAIILEFKVFNPRKERSLDDTVQEALKQIEEKQYAVQLMEHGISAKHIRSYGFAFQGKKVLIVGKE